MQENLPLVHLSMPTFPFFLQMSSLMAGVFSAQWQNSWMDDEDVSLICVMSSFIVPPAPDIFFFFFSFPEFLGRISNWSADLSGWAIAKIRSKSGNLNTFKHIRHYSHLLTLTSSNANVGNVHPCRVNKDSINK